MGIHTSLSSEMKTVITKSITENEKFSEVIEMALNENIKKYRKSSGLTQKALAGKSELSFSMISKLESGQQTNPSFETLRKIADVLGVSPAELISTPLSIEDQIDEYIAYKRGLVKTHSNAIVINKESDPEDPCADLNFKRKLQAINNTPVPFGDTNHENPEYLEKSPEMIRLFSLLRNATSDEILQVTRLLETFL